MPKRTDIHSVLIIGAGPIIIGQACEFDYSGTQACKALKEEGYRVILINSNPATIMTDPEFADRTYIEPITPECVEKIIVREKEEMKKLGAKGKLVLLPTLGGQTALNTAMALHKDGVLKKYGIEINSDLVYDKSNLPITYSKQTYFGMMQMSSDYPFWIKVVEEDFSDNPAFSKIQSLALLWSSSLKAESNNDYDVKNLMT